MIAGQQGRGRTVDPRSDGARAMAEAQPHDPSAPAEPFALLWAEPSHAPYPVGPDRKAGRAGLACRWTRDRANRRLVSVWARRRPEIAVG